MAVASSRENTSPEAASPPKGNAASGVAVAQALCSELPQAGTDGKVPEWIQLLPEGAAHGDLIRGRDGRRFRMSNVDAVIARHTEPLAVDVEHGVETGGLLGGSTAAIGWVEPGDIQYREDGSVWARPAWNTEGARIVRERMYRGTSPAFLHSMVLDDEEVPEIFEFTSVAATNRPNLHMSALNKRGATEPEPTAEEPRMKQIAKALGLAPDASEAEILAALNSEREANRDKVADVERQLHSAQTATPPMEKYVPRSEFDRVTAELNSVQEEKAKAEKERLEQAIHSAVDAAVEAGKVVPANKDYFLAQCRTEGGLERFKEFVASAPVVVGEPQKVNPVPKDGELSLNAEQRELLKRARMSPEDLAKYGQKAEV